MSAQRWCETGGELAIRELAPGELPMYSQRYNHDREMVSETRFVSSSIPQVARSWLQAGDRAAQGLQGYIGSQIVRLTVPRYGGQITFAFSSTRDYERWETSEARNAWLRQAKDQQFVRGYLSVWGLEPNPKSSVPQRVSSLPRWKQTVIIYMSFLRLSLSMNYSLASIPVDLSTWMKVTVSVGILTPV